MRHIHPVLSGKSHLPAELVIHKWSAGRRGKSEPGIENRRKVDNHRLYGK
jgi:hypothetical protein